MKKTSYLFLADGFEEIEALATVDILRRANMAVKTVSITSATRVSGAHGVKVEADMKLSELDPTTAEWLILPGGLPGATYLHESVALGELLKTHHQQGGRIAAICASPAFVLSPLGILDGREATGYPGTHTESEQIAWRDASVVVSENVVTANGPASTISFALAIVAETLDDATAKNIGSDMLL